MQSQPRPLTHRSRNLFTALQLNPGQRPQRSTRHKHSQTSRKPILLTDENYQPLNQTFRWVVDKSSSYKQHQQLSLSQTLTSLKKTLNLKLQESKKLAEKNKRIRGYTKSVQQEISCYSLSAVNLKQRIAKTETLIQQSRHKQEQLQFDRKILDSMLIRMKSDKIYYGLEQKRKEKTLKFKTLDCYHHEAERMSLANVESLIGRHLTSMQHEVERLQHNRDIQIFEAQNAIKRQTRQRINIEERQNIPRLDELHVRKTLLIHTLLEQLLRTKMLRLTKQHKKLDTSFRKIKTATNINNIEDLVHKYFSEDNLYLKLKKEIQQLENRMRKNEERNLELELKLKNIQTINLMEIRPRKFIKVIQTEQADQRSNGKMDMITSWIEEKSKQLKIGHEGKSHLDIFMDLCQELEVLAKDKHLADEFFSKKFFNEGISVKRQPKMLTLSRQQQKLALLSNNTREWNQSELEHFNKMRINVLRHHKSKTEG